MAENSSGVRDIVTNLKTFSEALARNSDRIDGILDGRGENDRRRPRAAAEDDLRSRCADRVSPGQGHFARAARSCRADRHASARHPAHPRRAARRSTPSFADAQWGDSIPKLVQARLVQAFENFSLQRAVTRTSPDVSADQQLLVDIRSFQVIAARGPVAEVTLTAKSLRRMAGFLPRRYLRSEHR